VDASLQTRDVRLIRTFVEDFDSFDLSTHKWTPHYDGNYDWLVKRTMQENHEQQIYVDPGYKGKGRIPLGLNPFKISNGVLSIIGDRTPPSMRETLYGYQFTSGVLTTRASFAQTYGYFEMRAKIPAGRALWPAFWLLPTDKFNTPPELDVLEVVGGQPDLMVTTSHWRENGKLAYTNCRTHLSTASTTFHDFGALWEPDRITYFIDRKPIATHAAPPGYNVPMYMIINLAIGGTMVGRADETTPIPAHFEIDHILAFQITPN
jgi:beta-glucanase (GH16 family)